MDKVVHFEIPTDDLARAKEFYGSVFGWQLETIEEMDYTMAMTTPVNQKTQMPTEPGAINGGITKRSADTPAPVLTIGVESVDDALKQVEAAGGSVVTPKTAIPNMGAFGYFKDTEGNVLGVYEGGD